MYDPVLATQLAVLVADRVEAMRTGGHDRPLPHPVFVERRRRCPSRASGTRSRCPSGAPDRPCTTPPGPRTANDDACGVQAGRDGPRDLLVARIEGGGATDPVEDLEAVELARRRRPPTPSGPRRAAASSSPAAPRRAGPTDCPGPPSPGRPAVSSCGKRDVLQDEVATQPDDLVDVLDEDRTRLDAGPAGHAVPDRVVRDGRVDDRRSPSRPARASCHRARRSRARSVSWG